MRCDLLILPFAIPAGRAFAAAADYRPLPPTATLEAGDSWIEGGKRYRLCGVQSCLRGTYFTDWRGEKRDCGDASMVVLAAFIKNIRPRCTVVAIVDSTHFVLCYRTAMASGLIAEGYGLAALNADGLPIHIFYSVAELQARECKAGLRQFPDVEHPALLLSRAARRREEL